MSSSELEGTCFLDVYRSVCRTPGKTLAEKAANLDEQLRRERMMLVGKDNPRQEILPLEATLIRTINTFEDKELAALINDIGAEPCSTKFIPKALSLKLRLEQEIEQLQEGPERARLRKHCRLLSHAVEHEEHKSRLGYTSPPTLRAVG